MQCQRLPWIAISGQCIDSGPGQHHTFKARDGNNKSYVSRNIVIVQIPKISGLKYNFKVKKNRRVIEDSVKIAPSSIKKKVILQLKTKKGWKKVAVYKMKGERITIKYPNHWKKMKISKWRLYIKPSKRTVGYVTNSIKIKVIK